MSTVISSQQQPARGPRRSSKKQHNPNTHDGFSSDVGALTEYQRNTSPAMTKNNNKGHPRKSSQAHNKQHEASSADRGKPDMAKATPVKQAAYAGATFQQSPAPSALPIPSFYSKSLPATGSLPSQLGNDAPTITQDSPIKVADNSPSKPEATPLDFLFAAARQARVAPTGDSPAARSGNLSVPTGSPASRSPAPREGEPMFPFELDGASAPGEDGGSFATPYKDRMDALKSTRSTSLGGKTMDEHERKAKTDALKKLLMKSNSQGNEHRNNSAPDANNPFNARAPYQQPTSLPSAPPNIRQNSGSNSMYTQEYTRYGQPQNFHQQGYQYQQGPMHTPKRPNSSSLRNVYGPQSEPEYAELSSDSAITPPIPTPRKSTAHAAPQNGAGVEGQAHSTPHQAQAQRAKPSAQQLEDDLRRVLKLDLTSRV
ncbi:hypothetical protein EDD37DRAFT_682303 [Exophiala viscosa]|uniref:uncharacterized protein n=1 Tax=Exophiala viscosa TaxID=2486360 RepID=UPI00219FC93D|nr:hypothetical protein EDD37DRAFT_682303 [Exophiala viscosa]